GSQTLGTREQGVLPLFARPEGVTYYTWTPSPTNLKTIASRHTNTSAQIHTSKRRDHKFSAKHNRHGAERGEQ
ncbi:hypothetical protein TSAR_014164, partial [Trichomalopsis sarcophagae]